MQFKKQGHNKEGENWKKTKLSEKNQTEGGTLDDPKKDVANSIVFHFTETNVNVITVTSGDDEDDKGESVYSNNIIIIIVI